ncbi:aminotransferase class I/II-fold pyridoxal phosphate-dependent enzyme [Gordonia sp. CPCC 205515]|uniref:aminotransferase class I/II-fold pyridoxal phosphate-dependent enzyme n=1 Tax=Gordonia sp. CPCC 205515 TaxID=3140791 RepID=UPI003AF3E36F
MKISPTRISRRAEAVTPFYAMEFGKRAAELEAAGHDVVKLSIGEPDFGAPPAFLAAIAELTDGRPLTYTGALGLPELRSAIAGFTRDHFGADIDPGRVVVTSGASAALLLCCAALIDPGDEVLVADPSYPCNRRFAESFGARVRLVGTTPETRYQLTAGLVDEAWSPDTRGVMVATPSNPTGTSIPFDELVRLCTGVDSRGGWRIVDEIYLGLSDPTADGGGPRSILTADPGAIVINSFSKYFGMTGWRLGWCIAPDELVPVLERLAQNYYICAPTPAQFAALECFTPDSLALAEARRAEYRIRRELVLDGLRRIGLPVPVIPDGAFYVYVDVSATGLTAGDFCDRALREAHVSLTPGMDFGEQTADTHIRLSYSASADEPSEGLRRLGEFVGGLPAVSS